MPYRNRVYIKSKTMSIKEVGVRVMFFVVFLSIYILGNAYIIYRVMHDLKLHGLALGEIRNRIDLSDDVIVVRRCDLCTVLPVNLITVVLGRIVACGHNDTRNAAELS